MRIVWLILAMVLIGGCCDQSKKEAYLKIGAPPNYPVKVEIVNHPDTARLKALEERMDTMEEWATRHGRKMK